MNRLFTVLKTHSITDNVYSEWQPLVGGDYVVAERAENHCACGRYIKHPFMICNPNTKIAIAVGSGCIKKFNDHIQHEYKKYKKAGDKICPVCGGSYTSAHRKCVLSLYPEYEHIDITDLPDVFYNLDEYLTRNQLILCDECSCYHSSTYEPCNSVLDMKRLEREKLEMEKIAIENLLPQLRNMDSIINDINYMQMKIECARKREFILSRKSIIIDNDVTKLCYDMLTTIETKISNFEKMAILDRLENERLDRLEKERLEKEQSENERLDRLEKERLEKAEMLERASKLHACKLFARRLYQTGEFSYDYIIRMCNAIHGIHFALWEMESILQSE